MTDSPPIVSIGAPPREYPPVHPDNLIMNSVRLPSPLAGQGNNSFLEEAIRMQTINPLPGLRRVESNSSRPQSQTNKVFRKRYDREGIRYILGRKWYRLLILKEWNEIKDTLTDSTRPNDNPANPIKPWRALYQDHQVDLSHGNLLICQTDPNDCRLYTLFEDFVEYDKYSRKFVSTDQCFYELLIGSRKPIFDIDIDLTKPGVEKVFQKNIENKVETWPICQHLLLAVQKVMEQEGIKLQLNWQILWYSSHGPNKHSYHLVINGVYHPDHLEAQAFFQRVIQLVDPKYHEWIDRKVYSTKQQFRVLHCQKLGSNRPKVLIREWDYLDMQGQIHHLYHQPSSKSNNPQEAHLIDLSDSLASFTIKCQLLPNFDKQREERLLAQSTRKWDLINSSEELSAERIRKILDLAETGWKNLPNQSASFPYSFKDTVGSLINLKRDFPAFCSKCQRVHDAENGFIVVVGGKIILNCRRSDDGKGLILGQLYQPLDIEQLFRQVDGSEPIIQDQIDTFEPISSDIPPEILGTLMEALQKDQDLETSEKTQDQTVGKSFANLPSPDRKIQLPLDGIISRRFIPTEALESPVPLVKAPSLLPNRPTLSPGKTSQTNPTQIGPIGLFSAGSPVSTPIIGPWNISNGRVCAKEPEARYSFSLSPTGQSNSVNSPIQPLGQDTGELRYIMLNSPNPIDRVSQIEQMEQSRKSSPVYQEMSRKYQMSIKPTEEIAAGIFREKDDEFKNLLASNPSNQSIRSSSRYQIDPLERDNREKMEQTFASFF